MSFRPTSNDNYYVKTPLHESAEQLTQNPTNNFDSTITLPPKPGNGPDSDINAQQSWHKVLDPVTLPYLNRPNLDDPIKNTFGQALRELGRIPLVNKLGGIAMATWLALNIYPILELFFYAKFSDDVAKVKNAVASVAYGYMWVCSILIVLSLLYIYLTLSRGNKGHSLWYRVMKGLIIFGISCIVFLIIGLLFGLFQLGIRSWCPADWPQAVIINVVKFSLFVISLLIMVYALFADSATNPESLIVGLLSHRFKILAIISVIVILGVAIYYLVHQPDHSIAGMIKAIQKRVAPN
ncbi:hypothetical protein NEHOM01_0405 [Nematocida homosporus]|uniref:uncharacterized protein n=1 Tax=Nematocida homosporus TaxID=1912981 RepID=UPI0022209F0A|nr:uncharacterized protein NEHOM01_0405 [Nematocida homosporus]KAI5184803.1 hypothetical protein NEHOM01_0405 [Nematocida homosporus]